MPHALQNFAPSIECVEHVGQYIDSALGLWLGFHRTAAQRLLDQMINPSEVSVEGATRGSIAQTVDGL
ncbi:MAG: hypothetical protein WAV20_21560 [Blastocatellia bacterium]